SAEVLGIGAVLQIMDREHVWTYRPEWCNASTMVTQVGTLAALTQPCCFAGDSSRPPRATEGSHDRWKHLCQLPVCIDETVDDIQRRTQVRLRLAQSEELSNEILLGSPDTARNTPQQIDGNSRIGHQHNSRYASAVRRAVSRHVA